MEKNFLGLVISYDQFRSDRNGLNAALSDVFDTKRKLTKRGEDTHNSFAKVGFRQDPETFQ